MQKVNREAPPAAVGVLPSTRRGEARHSALLEAARAVFFEKGFAATSIEDVVARVGGSKASVYSYFGSKEGLFTAILTNACERFLADLAVPKAVDGDVGKALTEFSRRALKRLLDPNRVAVFRTLMAESARFPKLAELLYEQGSRPLIEQLAHYFRLADQAGRLHCEDAEMSAVQFLDMVRGHAQHRLLLGLPAFAPGWSADRTIQSAVRTFMAAHAPPRAD
jgi:AcrR family transcriptional regulator